MELLPLRFRNNLDDKQHSRFSIVLKNPNGEMIAFGENYTLSDEDAVVNDLVQQSLVLVPRSVFQEAFTVFNDYDEPVALETNLFGYGMRYAIVLNVRHFPVGSTANNLHLHMVNLSLSNPNRSSSFGSSRPNPDKLSQSRKRNNDNDDCDFAQSAPKRRKSITAPPNAQRGYRLYRWRFYPGIFERANPKLIQLLEHVDIPTREECNNIAEQICPITMDNNCQAQLQTSSEHWRYHSTQRDIPPNWNNVGNAIEELNARRARQFSWVKASDVERAVNSDDPFNTVVQLLNCIGHSVVEDRDEYLEDDHLLGTITENVEVRPFMDARIIEMQEDVYDEQADTQP